MRQKNNFNHSNVNDNRDLHNDSRTNGVTFDRRGNNSADHQNMMHDDNTDGANILNVSTANLYYHLH